MKPVLKWAGGKGRLLHHILPLIPSDFETYCEPFIGGGAVLFGLQPKKAVVSDYNPELINLYVVIRDNLEELLDDLRKHENSSEYFYAMRNLDRDEEWVKNATDVERASRLLYLNKTCYNGLYRTNSLGQFNVPFGSYKNPDIVNENGLREISKYLNQNQVDLLTHDFERILSYLPQNSFVYFDPPYDPVSPTSNFVSYCKDGFGRKDQTRLKKVCDELTKRKIRWLVSNSSTEFIRSLYSEYRIRTITINRNIGGKNRGIVKEVLISNY